MKSKIIILVLSILVLSCSGDKYLNIPYEQVVTEDFSMEVSGSDETAKLTGMNKNNLETLTIFGTKDSIKKIVHSSHFSSDDGMSVVIKGQVRSVNFLLRTIPSWNETEIMEWVGGAYLYTRIGRSLDSEINIQDGVAEIEKEGIKVLCAYNKSYQALIITLEPS